MMAIKVRIVQFAASAPRTKIIDQENQKIYSTQQMSYQNITHKLAARWVLSFVITAML